ncbi:MAG TPA: TlyA family RNA methyltransferase [Candidatus Saccharimonadales bacterium]|nr:TlyA family RNA methyltransferase [Candidatus Saccharimonadales bacterium]
MKKRLDELLVERALAPDVKSAAALIMAGVVMGRGKILDKPGLALDESVMLKLKERPAYVSRGGDKLASVAAELGLIFSGQLVLDVGASTGGFADFALQHGAVRVYCVDVGNAQLDWRLRQDGRVVVMERTDIRAAQLPELVDIALVDVSFISLQRVLPAVSCHLSAGGTIVAMAKPQFEAPKAIADRFKGVIDDELVRAEILQQFETKVQESFVILGQADSKVPGARGNVERFYVLVRNSTTSPSRMT